MKDKIKEILINNFAYVYCNNCKFDDCEDRCDNCHRKYIGWEISESYANEVADKILTVAKDELIDIIFATSRK